VHTGEGNWVSKEKCEGIGLLQVLCQDGETHGGLRRKGKKRVFDHSESRVPYGGACCEKQTLDGVGGIESLLGASTK